MLELAAFFGNPGKGYSRNRHNAGFLLAEKLNFYSSLSWQQKFKGIYAAMDRVRLGELNIADDVPDPSPRAYFLMPQNYMNRSGESVAAAAAFFKIKSQSILVVHDELELPLGTISLKFSGGLGGHNGLRSMKACFGTADFWRLRVGIGRPGSRLPGEGGRPGSDEGVADWVLSDFTTAETETLDRVLQVGAELLVQAFLTEPETLLAQWGKKVIRSENNTEDLCTQHSKT